MAQNATVEVFQDNANELCDAFEAAIDGGISLIAIPVE